MSAQPVGVAVGRRAEALAGRADAAASKIFGGSCDRTAYAADTPILSQALNTPPPRPVSQPPSAEIRHGTVPAPRPVEPKRSLAELEQMPVAELKQMLAMRGVGLGSASEKAELVKWVQQHQDLPVLRQARSTDLGQSGVRDVSKSLADFKKMPIKELHGYLRERGVGTGSNTEKNELAHWVWQHRDLPVLRGAQRNGGRQQWARGFGPGPGGDPYDLPHEERRDSKPKPEELESPEQEQLEASETKLLEGATDSEATNSWRWFWIPVGAMASVALCLIALAVNDSQNAKGDDAADRPSS